MYHRMLRFFQRVGRNIKYGGKRSAPSRKLHIITIDAQAETEKAFCCKYGLSQMPLNIQKSIYHYDNACKLGSHIAMNNLGVYYHETGNHQLANYYFSGATQHGSSIAHINWASYLVSRNILSPAFLCYKKATDMNNDMGMVLMANEMNKTHDYSIRTIYDIYERASQLGNPYAKYMLATHNKGNNKLVAQLCDEIKQSSLKNVHMQPYYEELTSDAQKYYYVESGNEISKNLYDTAMGYYYEKKYPQCIDCLIQAKENGSSQAMFQLGRMYFNHVERPNPHKAIMELKRGWFFGCLNLTEKLLK